MTDTPPVGELNCEFCQIVRGETDARVVGEDAEIIAFLPLSPATTGHTLVVPKQHIPDVWSLPSSLIEPLGRVTIRTAHAVREAFTPQGLNIINSNGAAASQSVEHFHVHIVPRWEDDKVGEIWPPKETTSEVIQDEVLWILRSAFGRQ